MNKTILDPARVRRALDLDVQTLAPGAYRVTGGAAPHFVRGRQCDCADARFYRGPCKHRMAAYLHDRLDVRVRDALRSLTP